MRRVLFSCLVGAASAAVAAEKTLPAHPPPAEEDIRALDSDAHKAYAVGDYETAVGRLTEAVQRAPAAIFLFEIVLAHQQMGNFKLAISQCLKLSSLFPQSREAAQARELLPELERQFEKQKATAALTVPLPSVPKASERRPPEPKQAKELGQPPPASTTAGDVSVQQPPSKAKVAAPSAPAQAIERPAHGEPPVAPSGERAQARRSASPGSVPAKPESSIPAVVQSPSGEAGARQAAPEVARLEKAAPERPPLEATAASTAPREAPAKRVEEPGKTTPPGPPAPWGWTRRAGVAVLGLGAAAAAAGAYFGAQSRSQLNDAASHYAAQNAYLQSDLDLVNSGKANEHRANALFIAAGVVLAAGLVLTFAF